MTLAMPMPESLDGLHMDPAQTRAMQALQALAGQLSQEPSRRQGGIMSRLFGRSTQVAAPRGIYLWGEVGRGKTWLMDRFHEGLPIEGKTRLHFHRFMQKVHEELAGMDRQVDPVAQLARQWSRQIRLLCLDEFFVSDITDAMLLHRLLAGMIDHGIVLVTTSNVPPRDLYRDGLQRAKFLPAIGLLEQHLDVIHLDGDTDYRLRHLQQAEVYHVPADEKAHREMLEFFTRMAPDTPKKDAGIDVQGRRIPVRYLADGVIWFTFNDLCDGPRSQLDYVEIAREFHTVLVSGVPVLDANLENQARRFLALVDEFYDRRVKLVLSADSPAEQIYRGRQLRFEFQRCISRLQEMRSLDYLAAAHVP